MRTNKLILGTLALALSAGNVFAQPEKFVVLEEKTGSWCGWCPYGTVAFAELEESEPNFIGIAIHQGDPMQNSYYDTQSNSLPGFGGYPYSCADRSIGDHAAYSDVGFDARITETPMAGISVSGIITGSTLEITVTADFETAVSGDWRLAAVVTENNVTGTGSGYAQVNYFSGGTELSGAGHDWHDEPNPVPAADMEYDHVARAIAEDQYNGEAGSLPDAVAAGETHSWTYEVALDAEWDVTELHVVGMLINPDGAIDNAGGGSVGTVSIDEEEVNTFSVMAFPNPVAEMMNLTVELEEASQVTIEVVNMLGAVVSTIETQNLAIGTHYNSLDLSDLTNGVYFVKTTVNEAVDMTKIVVQ
ncbi:MAG: hypothetical protein ACI8ZM_005441 [Crocinitomix sp.]|jgi:hypothetical protein